MAEYTVKLDAARERKAQLRATDPATQHPIHYNMGKIEVIEAIVDWRLNFRLGNVVKYVARAPHKGKQLEDLRKARFYLDHEIKELEAEEANAKQFFGAVSRGINRALVKATKNMNAARRKRRKPGKVKKAR